MEWLKTWRWRVARAGEIWIEPSDGVGKTVAVLSMKNEDAVRLAHLIAAAPKMYAELARLRSLCASRLEGETCDAVIRDIDNLLTAARGEES